MRNKQLEFDILAAARFPQIDFLRGIAVLLVLFRHHAIIDPLFRAGWIGVDLFFVLSGYLVSSLLFNEYRESHTIAPLRFLVRRAFKIYPLFYTAIILTVAVRFFEPNGIELKNLISELLFVQSYFTGLWNHTWSLAVEEHFYIALSLVVYLMASSALLKRFWPTVIVILSVLFICLVLRVLNYQSADFSYQTHLFPTHLRMDSLLFGVLIAYLKFKRPEGFIGFFSRDRLALSCLAVLMILPPFFLSLNGFFINTIGLCFLYIGFGIILSLLVSSDRVYRSIQLVIGKTLSALVAKLGIYSYGIYLFHMFIERDLLRLLESFGLVLVGLPGFFIYFLGSLSAGILMTKWVEFPFLKLRDRILPR